MAGSLTIYASEEAYIDSSNPTTNYDDFQMSRVGLVTGVYTRRDLLRFDLSDVEELPVYAVISNVTLYLKTGATFPDAPSISISFFRLTAAWVESTVTWNTQPEAGATAYGTKAVSTKATPAYETFDIKTLLEALIANAENSFMIKETTEGTAQSTLYVYGSAAGEEYRPYIVVEYDTAIPTDPVIDAISTIETDSKEFTWSESTCDLFESSELVYEMQISLDNGATWGATQTSDTGDPSKTINFRTYLGLGASQYYYNANVKIQVRAKTPAYEGTVYYSEWVESAAFAIEYESPAPTPVYADENNIIDAYWWTPETDFGVPNANKTLTDIYFNGWGTKADGTTGGQVRITAYYNRTGTLRTKEKVVTLATSNRPYHLGMNATGRIFKFKIENISGSAINISGLSFVFEVDKD